MSKSINCSIDLKMISKDKIKIHANGSHYWNFSVLERREADEYGNTHYIVEQQTKDERAAKAPKNYMKSSGKEFIFGDAGKAETNAAISNNYEEQEDDLPF